MRRLLFALLGPDGSLREKENKMSKDREKRKAEIKERIFVCNKGVLRGNHICSKDSFLLINTVDGSIKDSLYDNGKQVYNLNGTHFDFSFKPKSGLWYLFQKFLTQFFVLIYLTEREGKEMII